MAVALSLSMGLAQAEDRMTTDPVILTEQLPDGEQDSYYMYTIQVADANDPRENLSFSDDCWFFDISSSGEIHFTARNEHVGRNHLNITVTDPSGLNDTKELVLFIVNVNDPPTLHDIPPQTAVDGELFTLDVSDYVEDPDLELPPEFRDRITYRDDTTRLSTDLETGQVVWDTPGNGDVGAFFFTIVIQDCKGRSAEQEVKIEVLNGPDAPELGAVPKQICMQDRLYTFIVPCDDEDLDVPGSGERLTFRNDRTELFTIDMDTGRIQFVPENEHVGVWQVNIIVTDATNLSDARAVLFEVLNENDPPYMDYMRVQSAVQDEPYQYQVVSGDPDMEPRLVDGSPVDPNEHLHFRTNSTRILIDPDTGLISFTPTMDDARRGSILVRITVVDSSSETATLDVLFNIESTNQPPYDLAILGLPADGVVSTDEMYFLTGVAEDDDSDQWELTFLWFHDIVGEGRTQIGRGPTISWFPGGDGLGAVMLEVSDREGGMTTLSVPVEVVWVPIPPIVREPEGGDRFLSDQEITVTLDVDQMGFPPGTELSVEVTSSLSGTLVAETRLENKTLSIGSLEPGFHLITVTVTDGDHASSTSLTIEVERATGDVGAWPFVLLWAGLAAVVVLVVIALRRKSRGGQRPAPGGPPGVTGRP
jgi:hypothetical protein